MSSTGQLDCRGTDLATPEAWNSLEQYLGITLRRHLGEVIERLRSEGRALAALQRVAHRETARTEVQTKLMAFRQLYLRTETTLDFFGDALNSRTNARIGALLRACDILAQRSMTQVLEPLGKTTPVSLSYLDKGLGASILKAGLRLWDGGDPCPVAAIKVTRHNLLRPTALIHEACHQVAHITGWNRELADTLWRGLQAQAGIPQELASVWAGWASEIAADAFAFAHTGFASVAALHDVVWGHATTVFRYTPEDPHPVSYLRVLLGVECCRNFYGAGPWDALALSWTSRCSVDTAPEQVQLLMEASMGLLPTVIQLTLETPMQAFNGQPLRALIAPEQVSPGALEELETRLGPALFSSAHWLWSLPLRILALTGLQLALKPRNLKAILEQQELAMLRLGGALQTT